ncbi:hypothetical protein [Demequina sp. NBRC 110056]|uniref:hypothetical protein n=1 Tax=Demequina sp. NBRC 110056 TaxID=1570345 RepID=UPI0009FE86E7|nr:hypothetical protein [Demequina sp. NBRC 110056]
MEVGVPTPGPLPAPDATRTVARAPRAGLLVAVGTVTGVTWAAALRAYMIELAGPVSTFTWWGTFGAILLPGAVAGGLLGWAWSRATLGRPSAWFALAPAVLAVAPMLEPGALADLLTQGLGGGAIGVVLVGLAGGYALGSRGRRWVRLLVGALWALALAGFAATPALIAEMPVTTPDGAWLVVLVVGLMATLSVACVAPFARRARVRP